jgi:hypothetical protein
MATSIIEALRDAITAVGGTPTARTKIGLLQQLITTWCATPAVGVDTINLLRELIAINGGTPTKWSEMELLAQLVETIGGSSQSKYVISLYSTVASLAAGGAVILDPLTLSASTVSENSANGTVIGVIGNATGGSTLSLVSTHGSRFAISGSNLVCGATALDRETATSYTVQVQEALAGAANTPRVTDFVITVTNVLEVTLAALGFSQNSFLENATAGVIVGTITGRSSGATLALQSGGGGRFTVSDGTGQITYVGGALDYETEPTIALTVRETHADATGTGYRDTVITINVGDAAESDVTAPTLSSPTATATSDSDADLGVTTNEGNGALYWVVTTSATAPSAAQVKAGQDHTGAAAPDNGSQAISSTGVKAAVTSGLTAEATYYAHFMHEDAATNRSAVVSSAAFTMQTATALSSFAATQTSAPGTAPYAFSGTIGDDIDPGFILKIRRSPDGVKDGNGDYVTIELSVDHILSYEEHGADFIPEANLLASGWVQPSGLFHEMYWWENGGVGADLLVGPRTELTDTIAESVATWTASDGDSRSSMIDTTNGNLTATCASTPSSPANVRASIPMQDTVGYWETTCGTLVNSNGTLMLGMVDLAEDFGPTGAFPFVGRDSPGCGFRFTLGSTSVSRYYNATTGSAATLSVALAVGDMFGVLTDTVADTVKLYHRPVSTGTWYLVTTVTMTSSMPADGDWWASSAGFAATTSWTTNFGDDPFDNTLIAVDTPIYG